jgi:agmatinase
MEGEQMTKTEVLEFIRKRNRERAPVSIRTFMGLPFKRTVEDEDFCVVGVPFDLAVSNRPGARFGPRAIREFMGTFSKYSQDADWEIENLKGMDCGDISILTGYTMESLELIYEGIAEILNGGAIPIILGGDHLITYAELRAYHEQFGPVAMVHFDSHNDTSDYKDKFTHGTPFRRAIEDGFLDAAHSVQVGIRGFMDTYRNDYAKSLGMKVITAREIHESGINAAAAGIKAHVGAAPVIVTFDIDFLDPSAAPGTGTPVVGGFTTYQAMELIRQAVTGLDVKGFDLVEVIEDYDPGHITALAACHIIYQFLVVISKNKAERKL